MCRELGMYVHVDHAKVQFPSLSSHMVLSPIRKRVSSLKT